MTYFSKIRRPRFRAALCVAGTLTLILSCIEVNVASAQTANGQAGTNSSSSTSQRPLFRNAPLIGTDANDLFSTEGSSAWIRHIGGGGPGWAPFTSVGGSIPLMLDNGALIFEAQGLLTNNGNRACKPI